MIKKVYITAVYRCEQALTRTLFYFRKAERDIQICANFMLNETIATFCNNHHVFNRKLDIMNGKGNKTATQTFGEENNLFWVRFGHYET